MGVPRGVSQAVCRQAVSTHGQVVWSVRTSYTIQYTVYTELHHLKARCVLILATYILYMSSLEYSGTSLIRTHPQMIQDTSINRTVDAVPNTMLVYSLPPEMRIPL